MSDHPTFWARSSKCCLTRLLHAGWYSMGKLHGSLNVIRCDSLGKNSTFSTLKSAIWSRSGDLSIRSLSAGGSTCPCRQHFFPSSPHEQLTARPHQMRPPVFPFLEVCHDTIHDPWLRCNEVYGIGVAVRCSSISDQLDACILSGCVPYCVAVCAYS